MSGRTGMSGECPSVSVTSRRCNATAALFCSFHPEIFGLRSVSPTGWEQGRRCRLAGTRPAVLRIEPAAPSRPCGPRPSPLRAPRALERAGRHVGHQQRRGSRPPFAHRSRRALRVRGSTRPLAAAPRRPWTKRGRGLNPLPCGWPACPHLVLASSTIPLARSRLQLVDLAQAAQPSTAAGR